MRRGIHALVAAVAVAALASVPAGAAPDRTIELTAGQTQTWAGTDTPGLNATYWGDPVNGTGGTATCGKNVQDFCDNALIAFTNPVPDTDADGKLTKSATITVDATNDASDYDLVVYSSDANGTKGAEVGRSTVFAYDGTTETVTTSIVTTRTKPTVYLLAEVIYFAAAQGYQGTARF